MILNCVAIDDEPPALDLLKRFIAQTPFLTLTGSFGNAVDGLQFIGQHKVDLLFLDIQMPDFTGVELAQILSDQDSSQRPAIVFITAFDQFALEGFKLDVTDYILKPISYKDFLKAAAKVLDWYELKEKAFGSAAIDEGNLFLRVNTVTVLYGCCMDTVWIVYG